MDEKINKIYVLALGISFALSFLIFLSGVSNVVTSTILLIFVVLVILGGCSLVGGWLVEAVHEKAESLPFIFLAICLTLLVVWIAGLGLLELGAGLFLWSLGENAILVVVALLIFLSMVDHYFFKRS